jgi:ribonuclease HII
MLPGDVQSSVKDLDPDLRRRDGLDGLPHHAGDGGFLVHVIPIPRGSVSPTYHYTEILPCFGHRAKPGHDSTALAAHGTWQAMLVIGVDENGLGPRLGPLVATCVTLQAPRYGRAALRQRGLLLGLTDSKEAGGFGRMAFAESVALALLKRAGAPTPGSAEGLLDRLLPDARPRLRTRCPDGPTAQQCWAVDPPLPALGGDPSWGEGLLDALIGRSSLRIVDVQSRIACAGVLNAELAAGKNKLEIDLELFEDLISSVHGRHGSPLLAVCGMIGGIRDYASRFSRFERGRARLLASREGQRRYALDGIGEVRFEVDADARHLPVALASIVGKYVREIWMRRIGEFYRQTDPALKLASGYHDPVTTRFIEATEPSRRRLGVARDCFMRKA